MAQSNREPSLRLELFLLGHPQIRVSGRPLREPPPVKGQAMLFYLAFTRKTLTREALSGLFWGEMNEETARANLRLTLSRLRKLIGPCLIADRREVRCDFDWPIWIDAHEFEVSLAATQQSDSPVLRATLNLYRHEFLHDFPISDAPDYELWALTERERLHRLALNGLQTLLQRELDSGNRLEAINTSRRMLDLEPWHEEAHRRLMWLLSVTGQRNAALVQYESCCRILDRELGVPPAEETTALYEQIRQGRPARVPDQTQPVFIAREGTEAPPSVDVAAVTSPPADQRFVGRAKELETLRAVLRAAIAGSGQQMVEGESFTAEIIAKIVGEDARVVVRRLSQELGQEHRLVQAQSLEHIGEQRLARFRFRHQLFQHFLYRSLSAAERTYYHEDIGNALELLYGQHAPEFAGTLAAHFQAAGIMQKTVRYLALAAQQATMKTANLEAAHYARSGLSLLEAIPPGVERMKLELLLQIIRGRSAMYIDGYAASDAEAGFVRAMQLCEQMGHIPQIFPVMYGLWALYMIRGEFEAARQQALKFIELAAVQQNIGSEMLGHGMMGLPLSWMGALKDAREHLERLDEWYEPEHDLKNIAMYGQAALLARLTSLPMILCMLGYADQARRGCKRILQLSGAITEPISRAFALSMSGIAVQLLRDVESTELYADAIVEHCQKQVIPFWLAYGHALRGWVLCMRGDPRGAALLCEQINLLGNNLGALRATISLCRLWQGQDKGTHAKVMLQEIYASYVEGFDIVDMRYARELLSAHNLGPTQKFEI